MLAWATLLGCAGPAGAPKETGTAPACPTFAPADDGLPAGVEWRTHPAVGDVNEDGLDDIAGLPRKGRGPRVFLSDGLGGWNESSTGLAYENGFSCGVGVRLADVNDDGHLDLVAADHCTGVKVYLGNGSGSWREASKGIPRNLEGFNDADVGDVNGDGRPDILAVSAFTRGFVLFEGLANGTWRYVQDTGLPRTGSGWQILLRDVDADGRLDVVCTFNPVTTDRREAPPPPAKVWLQGTDGRFRPAAGFPEEGRYFGVAVWPRPGRPTPDLLFAVSGVHRGLHLYESASGAEWTPVERVDASWYEGQDLAFSGVQVVDVDGDGCADLLANEGTTRRVLLALGDCHGNWRACPETTFSIGDQQGSGWGLATGDFNGDGRTDVISGYGTRAGALIAWLQRPTAEGGDQGHGTTRSSPARDASSP